MRQKSRSVGSHGEKVVKDIRRATRKQYSAEEKIRIVLDGLTGEESIAELCRRECIQTPSAFAASGEIDRRQPVLILGRFCQPISVCASRAPRFSAPFET